MADEGIELYLSILDRISLRELDHDDCVFKGDIEFSLINEIAEVRNKCICFTEINLDILLFKSKGHLR